MQVLVQSSAVWALADRAEVGVRLREGVVAGQSGSLIRGGGGRGRLPLLPGCLCLERLQPPPQFNLDNGRR